MQRPLPQRRHPRLEASAYAAVDSVCSVTVAVKGRQPVFAEAAVAAAAVEVLLAQAAVRGVTVYAYCVMPDHVHLVVSPSPSCDIVQFVGAFKNLAQRAAWRLGVRGAFWQRSFWDHFVRSDEDLNAVIAYVLNNPVRAGLADTPEAYRFAGRPGAVQS